MVIYSNSRISTFEQCHLKFKLKYIDNITPETETSIEAYLGKCAHGTLEWLYNNVLEGNIPSMDKIISFYADLWQKNFKENFIIVNKTMTVKDYFNKGVGFLVNYYTKHCPFDDGTLECEKKIIIDLDGTGNYLVQGFIDRLVNNQKTGKIEIHDYKTANSLPTQEKIDNDRQLMLYSIAIKEIFGYDKDVILVWHYLAHNKKIYSITTNNQLERLKVETINTIKRIELEKEFPHNKSRLCSWCEYKSLCPAWQNCKS